MGFLLNTNSFGLLPVPSRIQTANGHGGQSWRASQPMRLVRVDTRCCLPDRLAGEAEIAIAHSDLRRPD